MGKPPHDPSVASEPHMRPQHPAQPGSVIPYASTDTPAPSDHDPQQDVGNEPVHAPAVSAPVEIHNTVWDEPALARELSGATLAGAPTYAAWLAAKKARWTVAKSWLVTLGIALIAGPFAVVGAFWGAGQSIFSVMMLVVVGPLIEEVMKVAAPTLVVEKWPYAFRSAGQIMICAVCGGLAFAVLENLLYLHVYIPNASPNLIAWRWSACTALHVTCSAIAGLGVRRAWLDGMSRATPARMSLASAPLVVAAVVHGLYNATALALEAANVF